MPDPAIPFWPPREAAFLDAFATREHPIKLQAVLSGHATASPDDPGKLIKKQDGTFCYLGFCMSFPSLVSGPSRDPFFELAITSIGKKGLDPQTLVPVTGNGVINMSLITATLRPSLVQLSFTGTPRLHLMDRHCGEGTSGKDLDKDLVLKALKAKGRRSITQLLDDTRRTDTSIREAVRALVSETAIRVVATRGKARLYELIVPEDEANGEDV